MSLPASWVEAYERLSAILAGDLPSTQEWLREAVTASWGHPLDDLPRPLRALALQKVSGVILALEEMGEIAFDPELRSLLQRMFGRYFGGVVLDGPPWRVSPFEDRPTYEEWKRSLTDFV